VSTRRVPAPAGADGSVGDEWYHYVICRGTGVNVVVGRRQGNLESVTAALEEMVERMNQRRTGKYGRVQLPPGRPRTP
jgi:hypothetical protein